MESGYLLLSSHINDNDSGRQLYQHDHHGGHQRNLEWTIQAGDRCQSPQDCESFRPGQQDIGLGADPEHAACLPAAVPHLPTASTGSISHLDEPPPLPTGTAVAAQILLPDQRVSRRHDRYRSVGDPKSHCAAGISFHLREELAICSVSRK